VKKHSLIIAIFFLALTLTSSLKIAGTVGYYALFTEDFVERFCENKERPELNCDGKCALAKMLLQESSDDNPPINIDFLRTETVLFLESGMIIDFPTITSTNRIFNAYTNHYSYYLLEEHLHPPRA